VQGRKVQPVAGQRMLAALTCLLIGRAFHATQLTPHLSIFVCTLVISWLAMPVDRTPGLHGVRINGGRFTYDCGQTEQRARCGFSDAQLEVIARSRPKHLQPCVCCAVICFTESISGCSIISAVERTSLQLQNITTIRPAPFSGRCAIEDGRQR
jgi:hypothetical protein